MQASMVRVIRDVACHFNKFRFVCSKVNNRISESMLPYIKKNYDSHLHLKAGGKLSIPNNPLQYYYYMLSMLSPEKPTFDFQLHMRTFLY
jgi:hypothetical protein